LPFLSASGRAGRPSRRAWWADRALFRLRSRAATGASRPAGDGALAQGGGEGGRDEGVGEEGDEEGQEEGAAPPRARRRGRERRGADHHPADADLGRLAPDGRPSRLRRTTAPAGRGGPLRVPREAPGYRTRRRGRAGAYTP